MKAEFRKLAVERLEDRRVFAAAQLTGAAYSQNFNSLANTGTTAITGGLFPDGANVLQGWAFAETGSNANTSYIADIGGSNAGDTYSFGIAGINAVTDRAFGTLRSSSLVSTVGASFQNATDASFDSIRVSYTGEQWRLGTAGRTDLLDFQFSTNATSLSTGTWTDVNTLDFVSPVTTGTVGALDGNAAVNRITFSSILLPGLTLSPGATFWIRWNDFNASGADDGLAIDDFSISTSGTASAGVSIAETGGGTAVTEGGTTDTYSIVLQSPPTANVTITINPGSQVATAPTSLTFTPANWATAQVVTVTAVNDTAVEGTHFGTITHAATSSDPAYNVIAIGSVTATITDNDGTLTTTNLRVVNYNIASSTGSIRTGLDTVLQGIGSEIVAGFARQVDLIAFQEVDVVQTATSAVAILLNAIYGAGIYVTGTLAGLTTGSGTPGVVYNSQTLQLLGEMAVGTISSSGQARQTLRHHFQPIGGGLNTDFYVYNSHWKGEDDTQSEGRRLIEAQAIRSNADALGNGKNILYVGDFNVYRSLDDGFQAIVSAGNGQAFDPINRLGNWNRNAAFKDIHTQAPLVNAPSGLIGGGLDDRFDFQLNSGELTDGVGLEYRTGTYHTFGNNGSVPFNGNINDSSSTALSGLANRLTLLNRLSTVSDHLPVVADYTFSTFTDTTPPTVSIDDGDADNSVFVNTPLTYTLTFSEDVLNGSITGTDFNNAGTATISISAITEITPGLFSVTVTPTTAGTIILRIPTGAVISDLAGNNLIVPVQDGDTVTAVALANPTVTITSANRTYNNAVYTASALITGGNLPLPTLSFVYYSNAGGTDVILAPENVGTYFVRAFAAANEGNNAASSAPATFQITQKAATVTTDAKSKVFGSADPAFTFAATGLVGSDTQGSISTGTLTRVAGENVGAYAIQQGTVSLGGNYSVTYVGADLTINAAPVAPTFTGSTVNGNGESFLNPAQRSQITSLVLTFSAPVNIAPNAFTVANVGLLTAQAAAALASSQIIVTGSGTSTITLTWANGNATGSNGVVSRAGTGNRSSSLADGNWQLSIDSSKVTAASGGQVMTGNSTFGAAAADGFFRMYGDANGDGRVDGGDLVGIRNALKLGALYNAAFDWDGNGSISAGSDTTNFSLNQNRRKRLF